MILFPSPFLPHALLADSVTSAASGLLMLLAAGPLGEMLGLPVDLLRWAGVALLPFAAFAGWLSLRDRIPRMAVWAVVGLNVLWAADCILLLVSGWVTPRAAGTVFVLAHAAVVLMYAELQIMGLRRSGKMAV